MLKKNFVPAHDAVQHAGTTWKELKLTRHLKPVQSPATLVQAIPASRISMGTVHGVNDAGYVLVQLYDDPENILSARLATPHDLEAVHEAIALKCDVVLLHGCGLDHPVVLTFVQPLSHTQPGARVGRCLKSSEKITLEAGAARLVLSADGTVSIRGAKLLTVTDGVTQIAGARVEIN